MPDLRPQIVAAEARQFGGRLALPSNRGWRMTAIVASLAVALGLACCAVAAPAADTSANPPTVVRPWQRSVIKQLNAVRREHGLLPLRIAAGLAAAARAHSLEMARLGYFSHNSAGGESFARRIARFYPMGKRRHWAAGENLYWSSGEPDASVAVEAWLQSPEHRAILLRRDWREFGIGAVFVSAGPGIYGSAPVTIVTADFGARG
jgi:uncharacterized protein YkwD